jgi:hypothetical protein
VLDYSKEFLKLRGNSIDIAPERRNKTQWSEKRYMKREHKDQERKRKEKHDVRGDTWSDINEGR